MIGLQQNPSFTVTKLIQSLFKGNPSSCKKQLSFAFSPWQAFQTNQFSLFVIVLLWTFKMQTKTCRVSDVGCRFFLSEHCMAWPWGESAGTSTAGKIGSCLKCFPPVNNLSQCRLMDFKLFGNVLLTLPRLTGSNNCFSITDIFPLGIVLTLTRMLKPCKLAKLAKV